MEPRNLNFKNYQKKCISIIQDKGHFKLFLLNWIDVNYHAKNDRPVLLEHLVVIVCKFVFPTKFCLGNYCKCRKIRAAVRFIKNCRDKGPVRLRQNETSISPFVRFW